jgi:hypothetical protein
MTALLMQLSPKKSPPKAAAQLLRQSSGEQSGDARKALYASAKDLNITPEQDKATLLHGGFGAPLPFDDRSQKPEGPATDSQRVRASQSEPPITLIDAPAAGLTPVSYDTYSEKQKGIAKKAKTRKGWSSFRAKLKIGNAIG